MPGRTHRPVLLREALDALACRAGGLWVDGTAGAGGHAEAILHATAPAGRLVAIDRDADAVEAARRRLEAFGERAILRHADFRQLPLLLDEIGARTVSGILLDLGISSLQLDDPGRGFSFREDGPLDMRMDRSQTATAADLVNTLPEDRLASILKDFGEEPRARPIARAIVRARGQAPIRTTRSLADLVASVLPRRGPVRIHPATRAFQALRIAVNDELEGLSRLLEQAVGRLEPGGRIVVIAFHSLEDRLVKRTLRGLTRRCVCPRDLPVCACGRPGLVRLITSRPVRPSASEVRDNPRSRSARLRAAERLGATPGRAEDPAEARA
ncbi:MAG: 16S rRNA (cytosine(1402)-N(4))-methyltransferase [Acidobacteria bacterium]|nr:MAG: 16S rRNA (cytosine(1402)-N(4))-methyltransferase [Acidobacteriota bacterium]